MGEIGSHGVRQSKMEKLKHACFHLYVKATKVNFIEREENSGHRPSM